MPDLLHLSKDHIAYFATKKETVEVKGMFYVNPKTVK